MDIETRETICGAIIFFGVPFILWRIISHIGTADGIACFIGLLIFLIMKND